MATLVLQPGWVLGKTEKGREEVQARSRNLSPGVRHLLILADGRRSAQELQGMVQGMAPDPQRVRDGLELLVQQGFLEAVDAVADRRQRLLQLAAEWFPGQERPLNKLRDAADDRRALLEAVEGCVKFGRMFIDPSRAAAFERAARAVLDEG